jgi:hypothetical protein
VIASGSSCLFLKKSMNMALVNSPEDWSSGKTPCSCTHRDN